LASRPPEDFRAYELYLRGRSFVGRRGDVAAMREAAALFEEALRLDPNYAPAHAGLAETYYALWDWIPLFGEETEPSLDRALESARRAVQLDPGLAYAHAVLGWILFLHYDWPDAMASLERALELDPGSAQAHLWLGTVLMMRGEKARSLAEVEQALRLDPLSPNINWQLGRFLVFIGQLDEGIDRLHQALQLNPANNGSRFYMAWAYDKQARERAAVEAMLPLSPGVARPLLRAGTRLFGVDFLVRALYTLAAWRSDTPCLPNPYMGAAMLAHLGDREGTFRCLGEVIDRGKFDFIKVDPFFDPYRDDPRFQALLARVGLAD
jgi:serine/threonine-protein kinase